EIDTPLIAEAGITLAGLRVQRVEILSSLDEDSFIATVGPIGDTACAVALELARRKRLLHPDGLTSRGVECLGQTDAVRGVENTVDHQRCRTKIRWNSQLGIFGRERGIDCRTPPRDSQPGDVVLVDLVERCVFRATGVAVVTSPLTALCAVLGRQRRGTGPNRERHGCDASKSTHAPPSSSIGTRGQGFWGRRDDTARPGRFWCISSARPITEES